MNVTQTSTTNPGFSNYDGVSGDMAQANGVVYFQPHDTTNGTGYRTSHVLPENVVTEGNAITVKTRNSVYVYEKEINEN